jgi:predicted esterase
MLATATVAQTPGPLFALPKDRVERAVVVFPGDNPPISAAGAEADQSVMLRRLSGRLAVLSAKELGSLSSAQTTKGLPAERVPDPSPVVDVLIQGKNSIRRIRINEGSDGSMFAEEALSESPSTAGADVTAAPHPATQSGNRHVVKLDRERLLKAALDQGWAWPVFRPDVDKAHVQAGQVVELEAPFSQGRLVFDKTLMSARMFGGRAIKMARADRVLSAEKFYVRLPRNYSACNPAGVLVWIDAGPVGQPPEVFNAALDDLNILCVSAANSGNDRPAANRFQLAFDALATAQARFHIDPERVYVCGISGGARIASMLQGCFPDVFAGAVPIVGLNSYQSTPAPSGGVYPAAYTKPQGRTWEQLLKRRIACMTGQRDFNYFEITTSVQILKGDGLEIKTFENAQMGHQLPEEKWFADAIKWVDEPQHDRAAQHESDAAKALDVYKKKWGKNADKPGASAVQRAELARLTDQHPWTRAAWQAAELLGFSASSMEPDAPATPRPGKP